MRASLPYRDRARNISEACIHLLKLKHTLYHVLGNTQYSQITFPSTTEAEDHSWSLLTQTIFLFSSTYFLQWLEHYPHLKLSLCCTNTAPHPWKVTYHQRLCLMHNHSEVKVTVEEKSEIHLRCIVLLFSTSWRYTLNIHEGQSEDISLTTRGLCWPLQSKTCRGEVMQQRCYSNR